MDMISLAVCLLAVYVVLSFSLCCICDDSELLDVLWFGFDEEEDD